MSTTLDTPPVIDPSTVSFAPTAIRYGLIGGLITVIYALLGILTGFSHPDSGWLLPTLTLILGIAIFIGVIVYGVRHHRDNELGGLITFGRAFMLAIVIALFSVVLGKIFNYLYFNYIDTAYLSSIVEGWRETFENLGMDGDDLEEQMENIEKSTLQQGELLGGLPISLGVTAAISAIIALIMKKDLSIS